MYHGRLRGTYYEMGRSRGSALYGVGFRIPPQEERRVRFAEECEGEIARVFPRILDELHGFAEGCHARYEDVLSFIAGIGIWKPSPACSLFAAAGANGTIFGRNYDFFYSFADYAEHIVLAPDGALSSAGDSDVFIGREDGVNEKGLAVGMSSVESKARGPGLNFGLAVRCILDSCGSVQSALDSVRRIHFSTSTNYLLADRSGAMAVAETSPERVRVREPKADERFLVATNHFVHQDMAGQEDLGQRAPDSVQRFDAIARVMAGARGDLTVGKAEAVLSDNGSSVCAHYDDIRLGTLWSTVANLTARKLFLAEGHPCKAKYAEIPFP